MGKILHLGGRFVSAMFEDGGLYHTQTAYRLLLNGTPAGKMATVVHTVYGLKPDTDYVLEAYAGDALVARWSFRTKPESVTLNVRDFGAVGDGIHEDTAAIQAAILCCPPDGRVLMPAGRYLVHPLFLKSHQSVEIAKNAVLLLERDRRRFPILPGMVLSTNETEDYNFASWEGNPLDCFASLLTGMNVEDVTVYGEGVLDGQADKSDWWVNPREKRGAWRGRMVFLNRCHHVHLIGLTIKNSPSWNLHPYFSNELKLLNLTVQGPSNSPNTDGFDPESCQRILAAGLHFSVGDDCIAIKSGKIYMGKRYQTPCRDLEIMHCLMENGHGGVTIGSEMAGGVQEIRVHDCLMRNTDRGLRIKTRRGRGKDGLIDGIVFDHVQMEKVGTPLCVNAMYFCDPDGHSEYVQTRLPQPVDENTPTIGQIVFRHVKASGAACAGYVLGLPEQPVRCIQLQQVAITCDPNAKPMQPIMSDGIPEMHCAGLIAENIAQLVLDEVHISGCEGNGVTCDPSVIECLP